LNEHVLISFLYWKSKGACNKGLTACSYFLTELHLTALIYSQKKPIRERKK